MGLDICDSKPWHCLSARLRRGGCFRTQPRLPFFCLVVRPGKEKNISAFLGKMMPVLLICLGKWR